MAQNDNGQERSEEATGKRKQESRDKGQIARSKELTTVIMMLVGCAGFLLLGKDMVTGLEVILRNNLSLQREAVFDTAAMLRMFADSAFAGLALVTPLMCLLIVVAILAPMALGGWSFSIKPLQPDLKKIDPIKGMGRIFSAKSLAELVKSVIKLGLVGAVGYWLLVSKMDIFLSLGYEDVNKGIAHLGDELIFMVLWLSSALILVAILDVPFQIWDHARQQRMTKQEVKDEFKDTEGSPELKSKIRQTQQEIAQRRMMEEVPKADVVITNPTHYSVALKYDQEKSAAPIVVALGVDEVAGHIRRIAVANDVLIVSAPPLARAIYHHTELNEEIPAGLFLAVAQVLAYVFQLRHYNLNGGVAPEFDADMPIPDDLKRDEE
ncbi:Flagellar biosynthesis protein FlhB [hydrothermal vent metagenome]|uniref:Flagellar biosynthetic protein FlhB n=1 Tax=hydrothermal vent metagenome TaxID=652676 RepID=A0A3B1BG30_9ZZZZ